MQAEQSKIVAGKRNSRRWLFPTLRVVFMIRAILLIWEIAGNWNRWTGGARLQRTDDANKRMKSSVRRTFLADCRQGLGKKMVLIHER
jgi:hypothetical protein